MSADGQNGSVEVLFLGLLSGCWLSSLDCLHMRSLGTEMGKMASLLTCLSSAEMAGAVERCQSSLTLSLVLRIASSCGYLGHLHSM